VWNENTPSPTSDNPSPPVPHNALINLLEWRLHNVMTARDLLMSQMKIVHDNIKGGALAHITEQISDAIAILIATPVAQTRNIMLYTSSLCSMMSDRVNDTMKAINAIVDYIDTLEQTEEHKAIKNILETRYEYLVHINRVVIPELRGDINTLSTKSPMKMTINDMRLQLQELYKFMNAVNTGIPPIPRDTKDKGNNDVEEQ